MARLVCTAALGFAWVIGCGGTVRDVRVVPTSYDVATSATGNDLPAIDEDGFARMVATLEALGAADHAGNSVVFDAMMGTGFAYRVREGSSEGMSSSFRNVFDEEVYILRAEDLEWEDVVSEVDETLAAHAADPSYIQRFETFAASVAALARNAERANQPEIAQALYRRALDAPHDSQPRAESTPADCLTGDIALMALRQVLRKYANDADFTRNHLRSRLTEIAAIPEVEPAARAADLITHLDEMIALEDRSAVVDRQALALYWDQPYELAQLLERPLTTAMVTYEPLLDSQLPTRLVDHRTGGTDLWRLSQIATDFVGQLAGQDFSSPAQARAWWERVRADGGASESFEFLERNKTQSDVDYRVAVHVRRLYNADATATDARIRRLYRQGSPAFRSLLLQSFAEIRDLDDAVVRPYILESLSANDRTERTYAVSLATFRGTPTDEFLDRMAAMMPGSIDPQREYDDLTGLLANALLSAGRTAVVARHWREMHHFTRAQLATQVSADVNADVVRSILLDEEPLNLNSPTPGCITLLAADFVHFNRRVSAGARVDCEAPPEERRASRELEADTTTPEPRSIHTVMGEGIRVFVEGSEALASALRQRELSSSPEALRQLITETVRTREEPTLAVIAFRRRNEGIDVEIRVRSTGTAMGGAVSNTAYARAGADTEGIQETSIAIVPLSAMFSGAAPYRWMLDAFSSLTRGEIDAVYLESRW